MSTQFGDYRIRTFSSAQLMPELVWQTFRLHARSSNIMYPHAQKWRALEAAGNQPLTGQFWIVCETRQENGQVCVDFVLSCTEGPLGHYPIFIFTTISCDHLLSSAVASRISSLASHLSRHVRTERVYSVFAPEPISRTFASIWTEHTGIPLDPVLPQYYAAKLTYCDRWSLRREESSATLDMKNLLRPANIDDIPQVAQLCYGFAAKSEPFGLSQEQAYEEAAILVQNGQVWVHAMTGGNTELACIVAITRTSDTVAAITKVYTNPTWRSQGCAERLVRRVCEHMLQTKDYVVLYVAHNNSVAAKVYNKVGFVGLSGQGTVKSLPGVENWLELGFDRQRVRLGHW